MNLEGHVQLGIGWLSRNQLRDGDLRVSLAGEALNNTFPGTREAGERN